MQSELLESQLGLLKPALELKMESFDLQQEVNRWQTTTKLEDQAFAREALLRSTGGLKSGKGEERIKTAYDRVLEGFDYDQETIDMERENSLIDYESKVLKYEFDLSQVVTNFQDNMWDLISTNKDIQSGGECEKNEDCTDGSCYDGRCQPTLDYSDPTLTDAQEAIVDEEYDPTYDYNNDGFLDVLDMVTFANEGGVTTAEENVLALAGCEGCNSNNEKKCDEDEDCSDNYGFKECDPICAGE